MKKLGNLKINPDKVMNHDELVNLKGGYSGACCLCSNGSYIVASTAAECSSDCRLSGNGISGDWKC